MADLWAWATIAGLGAFHGLNPAMGWLFAVALGLQRGSRRWVFRALPPIALGHAASIALALAAVAVLSLVIDPRPLRWLAGGALAGFGLLRLARGFRHRYRRGCQVGFADLVVWSFFMASAHAAGLMVAPVLLCMASAGEGSSPSFLRDGAAVALHSAAMLATAGAVAVLVHDHIGLAILRRGWFNLDLLWAGALVLAGGMVLLLPGP